ncbi:MAG TPA: SRPBCC family protein [Longimicrobiales bacterium]|nr:SRPBCC family protein [Longimicrobiales bacterium]
MATRETLETGKWSSGKGAGLNRPRRAAAPGEAPYRPAEVPTDHQAERLARGLGWFSIGLGLAEIVAPDRVADLIGVRDSRTTRSVLRGLGMREVMSGIGILTESRKAGWLWSRVGGDAIDLTLLSRAMGSEDTDRSKAAMATAAVAGVALLDLRASREFTERQQQLERAVLIGEREPDRELAAAFPMHVLRSVTVGRPVEDVYRFWRDFRNLPRVMTHLESVQVEEDGRRSHWKTRAPAGRSAEWDAELVEDIPNELIAWRSLEGSDIQNAGVVRFAPAPGNRGTEIHLELSYTPPAGVIGATIARLFGEDPGQQIQDDLYAFKQVMETGEVARSDANPRGGHLMKQRPAQPLERAPQS